MVRAGTFFEPEAQARQKEMRHERLHHVMMPTEPAPCFVMVHPDFTLPFFEGGLDRPTPTGHLRQVTSFAIERRIAHMKLQLDRSAETATQYRPDARTGQTVAHSRDSQASELRPQRAFATFFDQVAFPGRARQAGCDCAQFTRRWGVPGDARTDPWPA